MAETGRPTKYDKDIAEKICSKIASGKSVRSIVKDKKMPSSSTIFRWLLDEEKKEFWEQYEKARNIQAELIFEELIEIADNPEEGVEVWTEDGRIKIKKGDMLGHRRLKVDTRKWYLSKVLPKKFGDKIQNEHTGADGGAILINSNTIEIKKYNGDSSKTDSQ